MIIHFAIQSIEKILQPLFYNNYFSQVHHSMIVSDGINVYSFALNPEEHQPSGTCNFSRIYNVSMRII